MYVRIQRLLVLDLLLHHGCRTLGALSQRCLQLLALLIERIPLGAHALELTQQLLVHHRPQRLLGRGLAGTHSEKSVP
jgi:hypothetical protein